MASGVITGTTGNPFIDSKIEWSSVANVSTNTSQVTASLYYKRNNSGYSTYGTGTFSIVINGEPITKSGLFIEVTEHAWVLAVSATVTVAHNPDGGKSIGIYATGGIPGLSFDSTSCSGTATLDTIARASSITSAGSVTLGNNCNVKWTPAATSFRYKLTFSLGNWSYTTGAIHPNTASPYTYTGYTIPLDVAYQMPSAFTGAMAVTLHTYSDSGATAQVGSSSPVVFEVTVPASLAPTPSMTLSPVNNLPATFDGLFVQGKSKIKATLSAEFKYGAGANYYDFTVLSTTYGANHSYTSDYITSIGTVYVTGHAVDTRTYGGYIEKSVYFIPYSPPKIQAVSVERCDASGNLTDGGTYAKISATREYSKVVADGVQKNFCEIRYRHKPAASESWSSWATLLSYGSTNIDSVTSGALGGNFSATTTYQVEVQAIDTAGGTASSVFILQTERIYQHEAGSMNAMGLGKYAQGSNLLDVAWDINTDGNMTVVGALSAGHLDMIASYDHKNFNDLIYKTGYYPSTGAPGAIGCSNYPVNETGVLEVISYMIQDPANLSWFGLAWQTYRTVTDKIFTRAYYSVSGFTPWKER